MRNVFYYSSLYLENTKVIQRWVEEIFYFLFLFILVYALKRTNTHVKRQRPRLEKVGNHEGQVCLLYIKGEYVAR